MLSTKGNVSKNRPRQSTNSLITGFAVGFFACWLAVYAEVLGQSQCNELISTMMAQSPKFGGGKLRAPELPETTGGLGLIQEDVGTHTTFLLGIFSMLSDDEARRRSLIRETYLSPFVNDPRVCQLSDYLRMSPQERDACRIPYTFVVGANPNGPTDHEDDSPLVLDRSQLDPQLLAPEESDVVYLNIKENMEDGKSPSWFKFGASLADEYGIDYVAKADVDTMVNVEELIKVMQTELPSAPHNVRIYGGSPWADLERSSIYMGGQFYLASSDLARYVGFEMTGAQRKAIAKGTEDMDFGRFVHSHPRPPKLLVFSKLLFWEHPIKGEDEFMSQWEKHRAEGGRPPVRGPVMPFQFLCGYWKKKGQLNI